MVADAEQAVGREGAAATGHGGAADSLPAFARGHIADAPADAHQGQGQRAHESHASDPPGRGATPGPEGAEHELAGALHRDKAE
eukprot:11622302-Alexandrium_andersonii.AAC.1